jgi:hypothetical protein
VSNSLAKSTGAVICAFFNQAKGVNRIDEPVLRVIYESGPADLLDADVVDRNRAHAADGQDSRKTIDVHLV